MAIYFRNIVLLIFCLMIFSCNGQQKSKSQLLKNERASELNQISIPENGFSNALLDNDGSLWFSSNGNGVFHFNGDTFTNYTEKDGLSSNQVFSIVADDKNNLWFGGSKGIWKFDGEKVIEMTTYN